ncbi:MAG TPA: peptidoglycan editing factor PgeF [Alphaproteobacteria bacterium]|nr:peptidoglycan editing factor PgeF [Alphaproteobacteria bacterium]
MNAVESSLLSSIPSIRHAFFGRQGGVSGGLYESLNCGPGSNDDPVHVVENRDRARAALGASSLNTLYQVHSADCVVVDGPWTRETAPKADAMVTRLRGLALGVLAADCAPVLLAAPGSGIIGAVHAGWRGAFEGVIASTITAMTNLGAKSSGILAAVGPCISQDAYEVGPEFFDRFALANPGHEAFFVPSVRPRHWRFDLPAFVAQRLREAGVGQIDLLSLCTYEADQDYFSYRRATHEGASYYGRNLSAIVLT